MGSWSASRWATIHANPINDRETYPRYARHGYLGHVFFMPDLCQTQTSLILHWYAVGAPKAHSAILERSTSMAVWQDLVAIIVAYLLGCIATAYYMVRL